MVVIISKQVYEGMVKHAESGYPHEVCGVMIGKDNTVTHFKECKNLNTERAHDRYELDPLSFNEVDDWARKNGLVILGIYHSHPDHPSRPSETDRERAWPDWGYIIFSVNKGKYYDARLWFIREGDFQFEQKEFEIVDE